MTQNMPAGLQNDTAVIMYKSGRKPVGGDKCEGRSCVRRARKNRWRSRLCVARRFHAKLAKDGDVTAAVSRAPNFDKK
jgi:hypothetical protein